MTEPLRIEDIALLDHEILIKRYEDRRLTAVVVIDKYGGHSTWFRVEKQNERAESLCTQSITAALRLFNSMKKYSYCETGNGLSRRSWHIRKLSKAGPKYGGGADTPTLCGRVQVRWDITCEISESIEICPKCTELYAKELQG